MMSKSLHWEAAKRAFRLTAGNSDREKYVFFAILGLWVVGGAGILFGFVPLDTAAATKLWGFLTAAVTYFFGKISGKELERMEGE